MFNILRKHKIVFIILMTDLFLYWLLFYSGVILPFINPSAEEYITLVKHGTSFPRETNQCFLWMFLQVPITLYILAYILKFLSSRNKS